MGSVLWLFWVLACVLPIQAQTITKFPANIEIDIIFPRNETYAAVAPFPIVFAIQNAKAAWDFGFHFDWELSNESGLQDSGGLFAENTTQFPSDPYIFINYTLGLEDWGSSAADLRSWNLSWTFSFYGNCTDTADSWELQTGVTNSAGTMQFSSVAGGASPDILAAANTSGGCALFGSIVPVQANLTNCPHIGDTGIGQNPCGVKIDESVASMISASVTPTTTVGISSTGISTMAGVSTGTGTTASSSESARPNGAVAHDQKDVLLAMGALGLGLLI